MSVYLLLLKLCEELERMMNSFLWGKNCDSSKGIHWLCWNRMCKKKSNGGMGFKKLHEFNVALLGKQAWRILTRLDLLVSRVYKARYFPTCSFLEVGLGCNPSYLWKSILAAQKLVRTEVRKLIGDGYNTRVFFEPWLLDDVNPFVTTPVSDGLSNILVSSLMQ